MATAGGNSPSPNKKQKAAVKAVRGASVLESLKDIGTGVGQSLKHDLLGQGSKDIFQQLLRSRMQQQGRKYSGELRPGDEMGMNDVLSGRREKEEKLQKQIALERRLREEERALIERKSQEIKMQLHAILEEIKQIAIATPQLTKEVEIAAMQAPVNPGIYHLNFFEKLLSFVHSFRKNIGDATTWLHAVNARGKKGGNVWGQNYKKSKGKYLLSSEHYLQRSAG